MVDEGRTIRVVVADDHALVLDGLRGLLATQADMQIVATATDGERLLEAVRRFRPDVAVIDV
jgi:DNA-binding NarL/FixJ family response regulator